MKDHEFQRAYSFGHGDGRTLMESYSFYLIEVLIKDLPRPNYMSDQNTQNHWYREGLHDALEMKPWRII